MAAALQRGLVYAQPLPQSDEERIEKGTANLLGDRRTNKLRQMRWSRRGADLLPQVRCAVLYGKFGSGLGQLFTADANPASEVAVAA